MIKKRSRKQPVQNGLNNQLKDIVLISNSMPKSASTYLYNMQRSFLSTVSGCPLTDGTDPKNAPPIAMEQGYVKDPQGDEFIDFITQKDHVSGPLVFKTHTTITGRLRNAFLNNANIFISTAVRDPVEIFLSARDNFKNTGEFPEFEELNSGCEVINSYFKDIAISSLQANETKVLPIIRYEQIVSNPIGALIESFAPQIRIKTLCMIAEQKLDLEWATHKSSNRAGKMLVKRFDPTKPSLEEAHLVEKLSELRTLLGYTI
jgi:hypothetical protein